MTLLDEIREVLDKVRKWPVYHNYRADIAMIRQPSYADTKAVIQRAADLTVRLDKGERP